MRKMNFFFNGTYNIVKKYDGYVIWNLRNKQYTE